MNKAHPKLVARGNEAEEAGLKFKGAPADDCDPFAIQNYIDRLAAEVYDSLNPPPKDSLKTAEDKDEWELMKEKAKMVPFQDVTLSIALKHGLMDEVKKENANKSFDKDSILSIMRVRDEFLRDYADANAFEYQWQIWVEWERYLKQIGVTIPQWGKIARKLIRLGVQRIQEDMTKKYSGSNKRKPQEIEEVTPSQTRRRCVTLPSDTPLPFGGSPGFGSFTAPIMARSSSFGGFMDAPFSTRTFSSNTSTPYTGNPTTPYSSNPSTPVYSAPSTPNTPNEAPFSPMQSSVTSPSFPTPYHQNPISSPQTPSPFGASLYNMIHTAPPNTTDIFAPNTPMRSSAMNNVPPPSHTPRSMDGNQSQQSGYTPNYNTSFSNNSSFPNNTSFSNSSFSNNSSSVPYAYDTQQGYIPSHGSHPIYAPPQSSPMPSYMQMQYTPPMNSPANLAYATPPTYMGTSPSSSTNYTNQLNSLSSSPAATNMNMNHMNYPPQFYQREDGTTHMF